MFKISVIVPFYNKEKTAHKTFNSLINQTIFKYMELICIDDCSKDNTFKIMSEYAKRYPNNIKIFKNEKNLKVYKTKLRGIKYATGDYIGFIDVDDWVDKGYYEELYNEAIRTGADIVQTDAVYMYFGKNKPLKHSKELSLRVPNGANKINSAFVNSYCVDVPAYIVWLCLFKKEILKPCVRLPPYENIDLIEDMVILLDCIFRADTMAGYNGTNFYYYDFSDEVEHETNARRSDNRLRDTCYSISFSLLDSVLISSDNLQYKPALDKIKSVHRYWRTNEFNKLFTKKENYNGKTNFFIPRYLVECARYWGSC